MRSILICPVIVFFFSIAVFGQRYETSFYDEYAFKNSVPIPMRVLKKLRQNEEIQKCIQSFGSEPFSADWFEATRIKLNNDKFADLLVKGKIRCLSGSATWFWFFRRKQNRYELVLSIYTIGVEIDRKKSRGFYKIITNRSTANTTYTTFYAFTGKKYIEKGRRETPVY